jgi:thiamine biosynthesis lipoprotein
VLALAAGAPTGARTADLARHEFAQPHMGTTFRLVLYARDAAQAKAAADAAFARVAELDRALSDYNADSELMALCAHAGEPAPVPIGGDLFRVLTAAQDWARRSGGAFDPTVGPVVRLWRRARRIGERPDAETLVGARRLVGYTKLTLDPRARTARLAEDGMLLDLGGIAKGYAADEVQVVLRRRGIERALVAAGGDLVASDAPPGRRGWTIAIALPPALADPAQKPIELRQAAVSTSGDAEQFVVLDGVRYSHIVDPRTGLGLTGRSAVAVLAPHGATADALATAVSVLGPERGLDLVETEKGAAAWMAQETPAGVRRTHSRGWR